MSGIKNLKEACIATFLLVIIFIRFNIPDDEAIWISIVNYAGLLVALSDLLFGIYKVNENSEKIGCFVIVGVIVALVMMIFLALIWTNVLIINSKFNDFFTLSALLFTLSKNLWIDLITQFIFH